MAFEKTQSSLKQSNFRYVKYSKEEKGAVLACGTFVTMRKNMFGNDEFIIKEDDGTFVSLPKSANLYKTLKEDGIKFGDYIRITYDGSFTLTTGLYKGKPYYMFIIEVDKDKKIDLEANPISIPDNKNVPHTKPQQEEIPF